MQTHERDLPAALWQLPLLPAPSLSPSIQFPGLSWGLYSSLSFCTERKGQEEEQHEGKNREESMVWLLESMVRVQASWLWVCEVVLLPANSSLIS